MENKTNVLILVTGMSPQVVTETLYGILQDDLPWPDAIEILTTLKGKAQAELGLITPDYEQEDTRTMMEKFCHEYEVPMPKLSRSDIFAIPDANGIEVDDARTKADQEALADFIVKHIAKRCADDNTRIHASIAGGRKTMTFYLGYAMSLCARMDDILSHVLVDERFENNREFYYPTKSVYKIKGKQGNGFEDASTAKVMLAEIPFIRQRNTLGDKVIKSLENESYRNLVFAQNAVNELSSIQMTINYPGREVTVLDKVIDFSDSVKELAFFGMLARHVKALKRSTLFTPDEDKLKNSIWMTELFMVEMEYIAGLKPQTLVSYKQQQNEDGETEINIVFDKSQFNTDFVERAEALTDEDLVRGNNESDVSIAKTYLEQQGGMTPSFFSDRLTKLRSKLQECFPPDVVKCIVPAQVYQKTDLSVKRDYSTKGQQKTPYGFWLDEDNIKIIDE